MMRKGTRRFVFLQTLLLRIAVASLPVILVLSLLAPTAFAKSEAGTYPEETKAAAACHVAIKYHGQTTKTTTYSLTVGELLSELNMDVSGEDVVSHGMEDSVFDGMELRIDHVLTAREQYTTTVPYEVSVFCDASLPEGVEAVLVAGVEGELLCTADVTYVNGLEVSRKVLSQDVTRPVVTQIVAQGTGEPEQTDDPEGMPIIADGYILLPTGEVLTYTDTASIRASAYTHTDAGCDMYTATGTLVHKGTVAVDPSYIPYGTRMFIISDDGAYIYGLSVAEDCGGAIRGDRMDLYFPTYSECMQFGRRDCTVYFLG